MNAIDRLLNSKGNPVEFFEYVEAAKAEVEKLRAQTANDAYVIHALRDVESERDALKSVLQSHAQSGCKCHFCQDAREAMAVKA